jgi:predicted metalloprotease with PDZ domain
MKFAGLFALVLLALPIGGAATPAADAVEFAVEPHIGPAGLERLDVTLRLEGDADGETAIDLPNRWAGTDGLHRAVERLSVEGGTLVETGDPARRLIAHAPGAELVISHSLDLSDRDPGPDYEKARPVVRPDWFYVHGEGAIVTPEGRGAASASFRWAAAPPGWRLASSAESAGQGTLTVGDVVQSILIGGADLRIIERATGGAAVRLALLGEWSFSDAGFADAIAGIIAAQNAYFGARAEAFLVTMIPLTGADTGAISTGGSGRSGGFALASTTNVGLDQFLPTLAHEYGHRWFGGGRGSLGPIADPDSTEYWFTEGFGDFVAGQILVRAGLWSPADYRDRLNALLLRYAASPARTLGNTELAERFWTDQDAMQMPYDRGQLFALTLDRAGVVARSLRHMASRPEDFAAPETQAARFVRAFAPPAEPIAAMLRGDPIALPADLLAPCGTIEWAEQPGFDRGFTLTEDAADRRIATVREESPAWSAGLRPGMRYIRRISFRPHDSTIEYIVQIADEAGERRLSWLPQARETVRFQRFVLTAEPGEACRTRLAGEHARP